MNEPDKVYNEILEHVLRLLSEHHSIETVAASLMAIAQRLYKTHLSEKDYKRIMKVALETYVQPYDIKKGTLH